VPAASVNATKVEPAGYTVSFTFKDADARSVAVAGDFNKWELLPLQRTGSSWTLVTVLPPGVYHYSFVVNGTEWTVPANATGIVDDGFGRKNATLVVSASKGPGES
jgi:1,4-alpha-glucan branching enzyme